ncbi:MAG: extracellular solute-binding protein [Bacteroidales bacterium]|nr:extracellular solute-binding protein [Bacteroidales bacterium]
MKDLPRILIISLVLLIMAGSCNRPAKDKVIIFHAGSLALPFKTIADLYMEQFPDRVIEMEAAGSVASARKITELGKPCDIMASADYQIIDRMLIPQYASWNIIFAANSMVIAYTDRSEMGSEINSENWYDILVRSDVVYGRADPNSDPCGYRSILTMQLAEGYYNIPGFTDLLLQKDLNMVRPKEVDLLALLEARAVDYIFIYRSVAQQHSLKFIELPAEIDLSDPQLNPHYAGVTVDITANAPGEKMTIQGSSMLYGVTLLDSAPNREGAIHFLEFLLGETGTRIMNEMGQELGTLPVARDSSILPGWLQQLTVKEEF